MAPALTKASISFRIGAPTWLSDERFAALLRLFEDNKGVTDEITFFTSETHPPLPIATLEARMPTLAQRLDAARALGYSSGINILSTVGHHNENLSNSLSGDYTRMTDITGGVCDGSFCPNDKRLQEYIARVYEMLVKANPDYIWIDDDVRLFGHMPILAGCFCDNCLAIFAQESGTTYTRDTLREAFNGGDIKTKLAVRKAWLQHNRNTLARLFTLIEKTVHGRKPTLPLGFMTGDRFFEGYDFDKWAEILSGPNKVEVMWRPGGGTYTDESLDLIADKAHAMGRQTTFLPDSIVRIQSELESFPYQRLKKSKHATGLEAAAYIAGGCTGTAFNVLSQYAEPLDEFAPLVASLKNARPFLDLLARTFGRQHPAGVYTGWVKDSFAARSIAGGDWFNGGEPTSFCNELLCTGLPAAYRPSLARVTAFTGDSMVALSEDEIHAVLASGVYMDVAALSRLNEMGYQDLTGFAVGETRDKDCIEQLVAHPLNGEFGGRYRNCRQSFWYNPAFALTPTNNASQVLSRLVDYTYEGIVSCTMGVFENPIGGRVCVAGYYPWVQLQNLSKSAQLKQVFRWLSKDTLPGYVASFHRANLWVREGENGAVSVAVLNASLDPAEQLTLRLRTSREELSIFDPQCRETNATAIRTDGPYRDFVLPSLGPWELWLATA